MQYLRSACLAVLLACAPSLARAVPVDLSFTGSFSQDDDLATYTFNVLAPGTVTLVSYGYAGGTNAAGQVIGRGGFDSVLSLFDSTGALLAQNDDGGASVPTDPVTGTTFDAYLALALAPGNYFVALSQFDSEAIGPNLSNGFLRTGQGNFTTAFGCTDAQPAFNDVTGLAGCGRTGNWAFDILGADAAAPVPEPTSLALLLTGTLVLARRRRQ